MIVHSSFGSKAAGGVAALSFAAGLVVAHGLLSSALNALGGQRVVPLLLAAVCAPLVPGATSAAWRSVLASSGEVLTFRQSWGCYGLGSLANTILPGRAGEAVRVELFSRRLHHARRRWLACGVSATVALAQSAVLALVLTTGAIDGSVPLWAIVPAVALPAALWGGAAFALRRRPHGRVACLASATTLPAAGWARLLGWIAVGALARLLLAAAVLSALSVPRPLAGAVVAIGSLAVGNALPFAPGVTGLPAAAMAVGLSRSGVDSSTAFAAALSFHAFETGCAVLFAGAGWLALRCSPRAAVLAPSLSGLEVDRDLAVALGLASVS